MKLFILFILFPIFIFAQTAIYRSVQPGGSSALSAAGGTLTISGTTATFSVEQPDSVGVGDVIQYDANGDGTVDNLAFIHGRTSNFVYTVADSLGGTPDAVTGDEDWDIFRSYIELQDWEAGTENTGIAAALRNFDTGDRDIDTANEKWWVACYPGLDSQFVLISGWTTSNADTPTSDEIVIYTPYLISEVGRPMRHNGVLTESSYRIKNSSTNEGCIRPDANARRVTIDGLQFVLSPSASCQFAVRFDASAVAGNPVSKITNCIIQGNLTQGSATRYAGVYCVNGDALVISNNFIYDFDTATSSNDQGIYTSTSNVVYIYNNTVVNCGAFGINVSSGTVFANGNVVQDCVDGYNGTFQASSSNNLSDIASDSPGTDALDEVSLTFRDADADDFHLAESDTSLVGEGLDISTFDTDDDRTFTTDIDGETRVNWHRGADEFVGSTNYYRKRLIDQ